ncbi:MAG: SPFH domain-containing protein [Minisyncoccota bacterium]
MWRTIIWGGPAAVAIAICSAFGFWGIGLGLAFVWLGFCIFQGTILLAQQQYAVIERLGTYRTVYFRGWNIRVIGVDKIHGEIGDMRAKEYQLYADESKTTIDFTDGSAPVVVKIWYRLGEPEDAEVGNENWKKLTEAIKLWVYTYEKPEDRVYALVDGALRPLLQAESIDTASKKRGSIAEDTMEAVEPELAKIGAYVPSDQKRLVIEDIDLPQSVIDLRQKKLEGEKLASEQEAEAAGYWKAIKAVQVNLDVPVEDARRIYETQRGLDALEKTKPKLTLIGKDLRGILGTINLGEEGDSHE